MVPRENPVPEYLIVQIFRDGILLFYEKIRKRPHLVVSKSERRKQMEILTSSRKKDSIEFDAVKEMQESESNVIVEGAVHNIRNMGEITFLILRNREGLLQTVYEQQAVGFDIKEIKEGAFVRVAGKVKRETRAPGGAEIRLEMVEVLSEPKEPLPLPIAKFKLNTSLETKLNTRQISLRNVRERTKFKMQEGLVRGFREYFQQQGFTEIRTPKIGAKGAEGGSNIFKLEYFHRPAVLAQSPQLYKQMMVGVFDRVFEVGPVFRAEKHATKRHLNEYTSLDMEMGYLEDFKEIMEHEMEMLRYTLALLQKEYQKELEILAIQLPNVEHFPVVRFDEAKRMVAEQYQRKIRTPFDLEPEEEALIGQYFKEKHDADFVFVTHYPTKKRPFYAMEDPQDVRYTLSFDLLFRGLEITTGGQRIHGYTTLCEKMQKRDMSAEGLEHYLDAFKYGMPPHGGLGIGLERLTMQLLGEENVRETTLFPRDLGRLEP